MKENAFTDVSDAAAFLQAAKEIT